jgi:hypothetical protein
MLVSAHLAQWLPTSDILFNAQDMFRDCVFENICHSVYCVE